MASSSSEVRTVAIMGQGGTGKTSVADALVFAAGGNNRLGRVDEENSLFDTEPEEIKHRCSISASIFNVDWKNHAVTIVDTPGQGNFVHELRPALRGVSAAVMVLDASSGASAEAGRVGSWASEESVPVLAFINRLDKDGSDHEAQAAIVNNVLRGKAVMVQLPLLGGDGINGVVDLLRARALVYDGDTGKFNETGVGADELGADMAEKVQLARDTLVEDAAECDDELLEKYLEDGQLSDDDLLAGLRAGVASGVLVPVLCGSAARNLGFVPLLDAIADLLPAPSDAQAVDGIDGKGEACSISPEPDAPFVAQVFKTIIDPHAGKLSVMRVLSGTATSDLHVVNTSKDSKERLGHLLHVNGRKTEQVATAGPGSIIAVAKLKDTHTGNTLADSAHRVKVRALEPEHPAISFAITPEKAGEEDKAVQGLLRVAEEDVYLQVERDEDTGEILLSGAGQLHVEVACEKLARKYGTSVVLHAPKVPYRETVRKKVKAHGRLKKQTGGHGQFADCRIEIEPQPSGAGFTFVNKVVGGAIPRGFIPAVEKGVKEAMKKGTLAGFPVVDIKVTLYDGQYHDVDSSEMAFKTAGSMAFKEGVEQAKPILLEPFVSLVIRVPDECMGDVLGDLNSRRAKVEGMDQEGSTEKIRAKVPLAEVLRYQPDLTSMTSGRGSFEMSPSHYEQLPEHLTKSVVTATGSGS
ncbi:MAG: elongation factor G [Proteobacteria bacterium]|nr:elongation factor G [Pseudomonadota bacterium]